MEQSAKKAKRLPSIRLQLLLAVNGVLFLLVVLFMAYDYLSEIEDQLKEKQVTLRDEANTLLPAVKTIHSYDPGQVQSYLEKISSDTAESRSADHYIVVEIGDDRYEAHSNQSSEVEIVSAMKQAKNDSQGRAREGSYDLVVGVFEEGNAIAYVSEEVSDLRTSVLFDEFRRVLRLFLLAGIAAIIVNILLRKWVRRPLQELVGTVRKVGEGDFSCQVSSYGSEELNSLATEIGTMSDALNRAASERAFRLKKAHEIQQHMLPRISEEAPGIRVEQLYRPAEEVGGDFFDVISCGENQWMVCIADATGHGVSAAMSAAMMKTFLMQSSELTIRPDELLSRINRNFTKVHPLGDFASMIVIQIDLDRNELVYANAGHDPAWLIQRDGHPIELLATGTLLGIDESEEWTSKRQPIEPGCRLAMSTDGITETFSEAGKLFGRNRLLEVLLGCQGWDGKGTVAAVREAVDKHRGNEPQTDDVTLLLIDFFPVANKTTSSIADDAQAIPHQSS